MFEGWSSSPRSRVTSPGDVPPTFSPKLFSEVFHVFREDLRLKRIRSGIDQQRFSPSPRLIVRPVVRVVRGARPRARVADALEKTRWGTRWTRTRRACRTTSGRRMRIDDREAVGIWRNPSRAAGAAVGSENRRRYASIPATGAVARCAPDRRARSRRRPVSRARAIEVARRAARRSRLRHRRRNAKPNERRKRHMPGRDTSDALFDTPARR
jgi:hypothetical protein